MVLLTEFDYVAGKNAALAISSGEDKITAVFLHREISL